MRTIRMATVIIGMFLLLSATQARAETFDAMTDYTCDQPSSGVWYFEGYRASDNTYLTMVYGHVPIKEVSRYGTDAHYLPDSGQKNYPFITKFGDLLIGSPATEGARFDTVLTWESPGTYDIAVSGQAELRGNLRGDLTGRKVKGSLIMGGKTLWEADIESGKPVKFELNAGVKKGDRLHLHILNAGDKSGNLTSFDMRVIAPKK